MLGSSDFLRKKICVTVFLDELFEELEEEAQENFARENREVDSGVRIGEERLYEQVNIFTYESDASNECGRNDKRKLRSQKPKQRSKFGKSRNNLRTECSCCRNIQTETAGFQECNARPESSLNKRSISKLVSNVSESVMTDESFLLEKSVRSQKIDQGVDCTPTLLMSSKSTQLDSPPVEVKKEAVSLVSKEQQTEVELRPDLSHTRKFEDSGGYEINHYDLKYLLGDHIKPDSSIAKILEVMIQQDAHLFSASSSEQISNVSPQEVVRVWSACRNVWSEGLDSELSEVEWSTFENRDAKQNSAMLDSDVNSTAELSRRKNYAKKFLTSVNSDTKCSRLRRKSEVCKQETKSAVLEVSAGEETLTLEQTKHKLLLEPPIKQFECWSKNFGEGDTVEEPSSNYALQFESKENLIISNTVLVQEATDKMSAFMNSEMLEAMPRQLAEVFVKKVSGVVDAESEMVFAESPAEEENSQEVGELGFEEAISKTKFLTRMKTVEIFEDASVNEMENISTELILICEDMSKEDACVESWQESVNGLSEAELYLKDSKESTMYLIEIPLHFIKTNGKES